MNPVLHAPRIIRLARIPMLVNERLTGDPRPSAGWFWRPRGLHSANPWPPAIRAGPASPKVRVALDQSEDELVFLRGRDRGQIAATIGRRRARITPDNPRSRDRLIKVPVAANPL